MGSFRLAVFNIASSQQIQFQWIGTKDSKTVVIPFILVGTYPTMDYATLGPSELQPPFTDDYIQKKIIHLKWLKLFFPFYIAGPGRYRTLYNILIILQSPVFMLYSRCFRFYAIIFRWHPLSLSYRVILQSSFNSRNSSILIFAIYLPVLAYSTVLIFFSRLFKQPIK